MLNIIRRIGLIAAGLALLLAASAPLAGTAGAQDLPPRPTVPPVATTPAEPPDDEGHNAPAAPGRITGTVIDTRTGAPAPGIHVRVGETLVQSDASGNYDLNGLPAGRYSVALELATGQGEVAQGAVTLNLEAGETVVQHLFYRSPEPPTPTVAPAATAAALPASLPATSGRGDVQPLLLVCGAALLAAGFGLRRR